MCGRTACTLAPDEITKACSTFIRNHSSKILRRPSWKYHPGNHIYSPSTNVAPSRFCPVLVRSDKLVKESKDEDNLYIIQPMMWGLIPSFYKVEIWNKESWLSREDLWSDSEGWKGPQLLKMAGIYSKWNSSKDGDIYSYTVLTKESEKGFSWLHHRIPVILESEADVEAWLDHKNLDYKSLLDYFNKDPEVLTYPVSSLVNNSRNQEKTCMMPQSLQEKSVKKSASSNFMTNWLSSSKSKESIKRKSEPQDNENNANKK